VYLVPSNLWPFDVVVSNLERIAGAHGSSSCLGERTIVGSCVVVPSKIRQMAVSIGRALVGSSIFAKGDGAVRLLLIDKSVGRDFVLCLWGR
jgi:hypothetical protein